MTLTIAIAGRPNVGKSTLFNRLIGQQMAMVSDEPGVTRDWREGEGELFNLKFRALDTAGLEGRRERGSIPARMAEQTKQALDQTDVILLVVDGRAGLTEDDKTIAREMRKTGKPIVLVANKCEGAYLPANFDEGASLGFGDPVPVSATHAEGLMELHAALVKYFPAEMQEEEFPNRKARKRAAQKKEVLEEDVAHEVAAAAFGLEASLEDAITIDEDPEDMKHLLVAVVGRPNAGKSTLINQLIGEHRLMTGPEPGLTRDAIPIKWNYKGQAVRLIDTAGLRRRARVEERLEKMSGHETLRAIRLAHVVVLVIDANQPFDKQDLVIAHHVIEEGRALVVAVNKWDTVTEKNIVMNIIIEKARVSLAQVAGLPLVTLSALNGDGLDKLMNAVMGIYKTWNKRVSTGQLNRWLERMEDNHPPPITSGRRIKLRYMTQVKSRPPTFSLWVNKPVDLPESYKRFLTHGLRDVFGFEGVPIRWQMKKSENPYLDDQRSPNASDKKPRLGKSRHAMDKKEKYAPKKRKPAVVAGKKKKDKGTKVRLGKKAQASRAGHGAKSSRRR
jgi:GTP-binding protein